tara:strand:+ start:378 stop:3017 length:2640 start_codon:yes stop_codon:yes gene_type:complete
MSLAINQKIEGKYLEESQKKAILENEKNVCVNAGAGSGKTLTILGKIIHLLDKKLAKPEEILIMAFNRRVSIELKKRVKDLAKEFPHLSKELQDISIMEGIDRKIHTFHSFCFNQIVQKENKSLANYLKTKDKKSKKIKTNEDDEHEDEGDARQKTNKFFNDLIKDLVTKDKKFGESLIRYFLSYLKIYKDLFKEIKTYEEYKKKILSQKKEPLRSPKFKVGQVRSVEECEIANFLFLKGIEYIYEDNYPKEKIPAEWKHGYKPDFHLIKKDEKGNIIYDVYIEHFGLDKDGNPPKWWQDREKYKKSHLDKIKLHKNNKTKLICTYSSQKLDGTLLENLTNQLKKNGIHVPDKNVLTDEEALLAFKKNKSATPFTNLLRVFLTNFKIRELNFDYLKERLNARDKERNFIFEGYKRRKAEAFIYLFKTFYNTYHNFLKKESEKGAIDFEDMIILGKKKINIDNLKYLIVDEFQDISPLRASLIKNLRTYSDFNFFCVGDDWQSIYRFAGGEIGIMVFENEFEKYFGKRVKKNLQSTHRFNDRLCEVSSNFILANNEGQLPKKIKSVKKINEPPIEIFEQEKTTNDYSLRKHVVKKLDEIFEKHKNDKKPVKILFLSRFNTTTYSNLYDDLRKLITRIFANKMLKGEKRQIKFSTIHKAKGAEYDYVFLMNVNSETLGFPSNIDDDEILKLIIDHVDIYPYEEERRLFYVALTRTKNKVFIYAATGDKTSSFIDEISNFDQFKLNYHYEKNQIESLHKPDVNLEVSSIDPSIPKEKNPARKSGIEKNFIIEGINYAKKIDKEKFYNEIRASNGKEVSLLVNDTQNNPEIIKILPYNKDQSEEEEKYSLGFYVSEFEKDEFFYKLRAKYKKVFNKKVRNVKK